MPIRKGKVDEEDVAEAREDNEETALIPKSLLQGKDVDPGDQVILDVVHVYDDEVEVAYGTKDKDKDDEDEEDKDDMDEANDKLDSMASDASPY